VISLHFTALGVRRPKSRDLMNVFRSRVAMRQKSWKVLPGNVVDALRSRLATRGLELCEPAPKAQLMHLEPGWSWRY
jgi:hypothetical protein